MQKALEQTIKALEREAKVESNLYESRIRVNESLSKATFYSASIATGNQQTSNSSRIQKSGSYCQEVL